MSTHVEPYETLEGALPHRSQAHASEADNGKAVYGPMASISRPFVTAYMAADAGSSLRSCTERVWGVWAVMERGMCRIHGQCDISSWPMACMIVHAACHVWWN